MPTRGVVAAFEVTTTIEPPPFAASTAAARRVTFIVPVAFTARHRSHCAPVNSDTAPVSRTPAACTTASIGPIRSIAAAKARSTESASVTSTCSAWVMLAVLVARIAPAVSCTAGSWSHSTTGAADLAAKISAAARPIPPAAPVTITPLAALLFLDICLA